MATFIEQFKAARRASTPIIAVTTPDPAATVGSITGGINSGAPFLMWDMARGLVALNAPGGEALAQIMGSEDNPAALTNPTELLTRAAGLPARSILFCLTIHPYLNGKDKEPAVVQAVWNLRDAFKENTRTLVIPCAQLTLPPELAQDVLVLDEPLPDEAQLAEIVKQTYISARANSPELKMPDADTLARIVDSLRGLAAFAAEQQCSMCIRKDGMDMDALLERKRQTIEQQAGLSVWRGKERFADIGGYENDKNFSRRVLKGKNRPRVIVFIDEVEKAVAGQTGLDGSTQEMIGTWLSWMTDKKAKGKLCIGPAGSGKSAMAKAFGNEGGLLTIVFDFSGMKGSLVGQSGANMRAALKVVDAVAGPGGAFFVGTCNDLNALTPEMRRRFKSGIFFYDLPTAEERPAIWELYLTKYGMAAKNKFGKYVQALPNDKDWTGADIETCCEMASDLEVPLLEAATYIVPVAVSAADRIKALRAQASGKFISASKPGLYQMPAEAYASPRGRAINTGKDN
jgi:hypothetical protein